MHAIPRTSSRRTGAIGAKTSMIPSLGLSRFLAMTVIGSVCALLLGSCAPTPVTPTRACQREPMELARPVARSLLTARDLLDPLGLRCRHILMTTTKPDTGETTRQVQEWRLPPTLVIKGGDLTWYPVCLKKNVEVLVYIVTGREQERAEFLLRAAARLPESPDSRIQPAEKILRAISGHEIYSPAPGDKDEISLRQRDRIINLWSSWWEEQQGLTEEQWIRTCLRNLIKNLDNPDPAVRLLVLDNLLAHTGRNFGYLVNASPEKLKVARSKWKKWQAAELEDDTWLGEAGLSSIPRTRALAAYVLAVAEEEKHRALLVGLLGKEFHPEVLEVVILGLGQVQNEKETNTLLGHAVTSRSSAVRLSASYVLAVSGQKVGLELLREFLEDKPDQSGFVTSALVFALGNLCELPNMTQESKKAGDHAELLASWLKAHHDQLVWDQEKRRFVMRGAVRGGSGEVKSGDRSDDVE